MMNKSQKSIPIHVWVCVLYLHLWHLCAKGWRDLFRNVFEGPAPILPLDCGSFNGGTDKTTSVFAIVQWSVPDIFFPLGVIPDIMPICRASYEVMTPSGDTDLNEPWNTVLHKSNERVRTLMHNAAVPFVYIQFRFLLTTLLLEVGFGVFLGTFWVDKGYDGHWSIGDGDDWILKME